MEESAEKQPIYSIYLIHNEFNDLKYIGQTTKDPQKRWNQHLQLARLGLSGSLLHKAIKELGESKFKFEVIETCSTIEELDQLEADFIKSFNSLFPAGYNLKHGGRYGHRVRGINRKKKEEANSPLKEYEAIIKYARSAGIKSFSFNGISIVFDDRALIPKKTPTQLKKEAEETKKSLEENHANSIIEAERALMWSSAIPGESN